MKKFNFKLTNEGVYVNIINTKYNIVFEILFFKQINIEFSKILP